MISIDKEFEYPIYSKICTLCKHLQKDTMNRVCKAFPNGIPDDVWLAKNEHKKPLKNQKNNIVFEKVEK